MKYLKDIFILHFCSRVRDTVEEPGVLRDLETHTRNFSWWAQRGSFRKNEQQVFLFYHTAEISTFVYSRECLHGFGRAL
jgi:hypothetical protein